MTNDLLCLSRPQVITTVHVSSLLAWRQMRTLKRWRARGKNPGGQIIALDFTPDAKVYKQIVREVMRSAQWCSVTFPAA